MTPRRIYGFYSLHCRLRLAELGLPRTFRGGTTSRATGQPWFSASNRSGADHDVLLSPSRDTRSNHRPPARRTGHARSMLPRLQILGSAHPNAPFRPCKVHTRIHHQTMGEDLSGSIKLSRPLHSDPHSSWPPSRRCRSSRCGSLDPCLPQHHAPTPQ